MQKNRFATYLSMVLSLVGLVLLLALPFVNMQGVRSFSFFGLLSGSGFLKALVMVLALVAPVAAIVLPLLKKKGLGAIAALLGVILVWVAYSLQVGPYGHACTMGAGGTLYFLALLAALVLRTATGRSHLSASPSAATSRAARRWAFASSPLCWRCWSARSSFTSLSSSIR